MIVEHALRAYEDHLRSVTPSTFILPTLRNSQIENMTLPPFIFYWKPEWTPEQFLTVYTEAVEDMVSVYPANKHMAMYEGIEARAMRGWLALAREHDLSLMLESRLPIVVRSTDLDYHGIDVLAVYNNTPFAIIAYTATNRGDSFHQQKMERHHETYKHLTPISAPLFLGAGGDYRPRDINGIKLYPWKQVQDIVDEIKTPPYNAEHARASALGAADGGLNA